MSRSLEPITDLSPSYSTKDEENVLTALADYMIEPPPKVKRTGEDIPSPSGSPVCPDFKAQVCSDLKATGANIHYACRLALREGRRRGRLLTEYLRKKAIISGR
jgi:hypothetical protein